MSLRSDLLVAIEAADAADAETLHRFRSADLAVETKADETPVSEADRAAERAIRDVLAHHRPDDGIVGEEFGTTGSGERTWILDPIDGTINYVRGVPVWGTLIALEDAEGMAVGVVSAPSLGRRWWAHRGGGAWCNAERITVSDVPDLEHAHLTLNSIVTAENNGITRALELSRQCERTRGFGDFWGFMLVAEGAVDAVLEPIAAVWDLAPLQVIVEEAGGRFTDLAGNRTHAGGNAVASNGLIHDAVLAALA